MATETSKRRTQKTIRNITSSLVHLRLGTDGEGKPYRIELQPRGRSGDWHTVPARLTEDGTFVQGVNSLFEIIPLAEAQAIEYGPSQRPEGPKAVLVRHDENIISSQKDWDGQGKAPERQADRGQGAGPALVDALGADSEAHANMRAGESALPEGAFPTRVTVEKVQGS